MPNFLQNIPFLNATYVYDFFFIKEKTTHLIEPILCSKEWEGARQ